MILDDRQRLSAVQLVDRVRRSTTNLDVLQLCDLALKLLPLSRPAPLLNIEHLTRPPPLLRRVAKNPIPVTKVAKKGRGRPKTGNALTPAQKQRAYRARKKAAKPPT